MEDFEKELKLSFLEEAQQIITDVEQCFLALESNPKDIPMLEKIFRLAHNLKGSSKAVGFDTLGEFMHELESFLIRLKNGDMDATTAVVGLLLKCNDSISKTISTFCEDLEFRPDFTELIQEIQHQIVFQQEARIAAEISAAEPDVSHRESELDVDAGCEVEAPPLEEVVTEAAIAAPEPVQPEAAAAPLVAPAASSDTLSAEEEALLAEFMGSPATEAVIAAAPPLAVPPSLASDPGLIIEQAAMDAALNGDVGKPQVVVAPVPELAGVTEQKAAVPTEPKPSAEQKASGGPKQPAAEESIRVSVNRLEKLLNYVGEMVILQTVVAEQFLSNNTQALGKTIHQMGKVTKEIQEISMGLRMIPLKQTFQKMQRIVRDTSSSLGKKVQLLLQGEETELDKTVLENLSDPLVHLIRNAIDHGIESPEERFKNGKPELGTVHLRAYHQGDSLMIEVQDDGGGIQADKLRQKAVEKGILKPGATLSDKETYNLIFHSGFSTKAVVTDVSGRGVGMDVVKTNIEKLLQGEIFIETIFGKGTCFKIRLPLTLAIVDGMIVTSQQERYVIPHSHVHETLRLSSNNVHTKSGLGEILVLRGENIPLFRLNSLLGQHHLAKEPQAQQGIIIVVRSDEEPYSILVDNILGQQQVVIKKLGLEHKNLKGFSGSAILGDGRPSLILELNDLIKRSKPTVALHP